MSKNKHFDSRGHEASIRRKKSRNNIQGFSTLSQVTGLPQKSKKHHSSEHSEALKTVKEPEEICALCGEKIENIALAIVNSDGAFVHFDCVINELKEKYHVRENQTVSYLGSGAFGLCEKDGEGKWIIVERVSYEKAEDTKRMKEYVNSLKC